ncbi:fungal pheromone STE3G-protein-coupled receptor [Artomyces pyxidatus]|uniref:Fungal pheromone STE3G-protein-coupled receptor n=1 Tax=Artomyces pyxidatus TaxID=48021 RepID=A0ACB8SV52_9AGAM|nr:fungal pheromone STE3G-protein-coupled receptor [Artomyces pyxidatus]
MTDPTYPAFPVITLIGFVAVLIPLPWHFQAWNSGTCLYMIWTALSSLVLFVNSVIWQDNAENVAPIWCDISSRFMVGFAVALPAASLCINRRLYLLTSVQSVTITREDKRRAVITDLCIGLGIPVIQMLLPPHPDTALGHRFNIYEGIGCYPFTFNTTLAYPLVVVWPLVIGLISSGYCFLTLRTFLQRRVDFSSITSANSALTVNRYFRLMAIAMTDVVITVPISAVGIYLGLTASVVSPWRGWADAHFDYSKVELVPAVLWRANRLNEVSLELTRWSTPFSAFVFFIFFGFALEARKHYRMMYVVALKAIAHVLPAPLSAAVTRCVRLFH